MTETKGGALTSTVSSARPAPLRGFVANNERATWGMIIRQLQKRDGMLGSNVGWWLLYIYIYIHIALLSI